MITALVASVFAFAGGTPGAFAHGLRDAASRDVVVVVSTPTTLPAMEVPIASVEDLSATIRSKSPLRMAPGTTLVFSDDQLPRERMRGVIATTQTLRIIRLIAQSPDVELTSKGSAKVAMPASSVNNGLVTFRTKEGAALDVLSLASVPFSRKVSVHWFYRDALPYVAFEATPEAVFFDMLGRGLGARVRTAPTTITLDFDASEVRRRALRTLDTWPTVGPNETTQRARVALVKDVLRAASNRDLETAFASEGGSVKIQVGGSLSNSVLAYLNSLGEIRPAPRGTRPRPAPAQAAAEQVNQTQATQAERIRAALRSLDRRRPVQVELRANFAVTVILPQVDANGQPAGEVSF